MATKTPVSLIHEFFAKRKSEPVYSLVERRGGSHDPVFVFSVSGFGRTSLGEGRSKSEARHAAALAFLSEVREVDYQNFLDNPYTNAVKDNHVGALQDFCLTYMISVPRYVEYLDDGAAHAKNFGIKCIIPPLTTKGEGRTKKQAKLAAAYFMLVELKKLLKDKQLDKVSQLVDSAGKHKQDKAVERLCVRLEKKLEVNNRRTNRTFVDRDMSQLFSGENFKNSVLWQSLLEKEFPVKIENPLKYFEQLMSQLSLKWEANVVRTRISSERVLMSLQIKDFASATFFGPGRDKETGLNIAALSGLNWLLVMGSDVEKNVCPL